MGDQIVVLSRVESSEWEPDADQGDREVWQSMNFLIREKK